MSYHRAKCRKLGYSDKIEAQMALARIHQQDKAQHHEIRVYPCPDCGRWHLTKNRR